MTLFRRTFLAALSGLAFGVCLGASPVAAAEQPDPKAFVNHLASTAMETMTAKGLSDQERAVRFHTLFVSSVDLPEISRLVLARHWRTSTPEQQQDFLRSFEDILVLTWATRFKDYGGDLKHTITGVTQDPEKGVVVDSMVERQAQQPIQLQWRLKPFGTSFKVVDLVVEGASMVITYRSEYAAVIQSSGGKVDGLLDSLHTKLAQLKAEDAVTKAN